MAPGIPPAQLGEQGAHLDAGVGRHQAPGQHHLLQPAGADPRDGLGDRLGVGGERRVGSPAHRSAPRRGEVRGRVGTSPPSPGRRCVTGRRGSRLLPPAAPAAGRPPAVPGCQVQLPRGDGGDPSPAPARAGGPARPPRRGGPPRSPPRRHAEIGERRVRQARRPRRLPWPRGHLDPPQLSAGDDPGALALHQEATGSPGRQQVDVRPGITGAAGEDRAAATPRSPPGPDQQLHGAEPEQDPAGVVEARLPEDPHQGGAVGEVGGGGG